MSNEDKIFKLEENKNIFIMDLKQNELADEFIKRIDKNILIVLKNSYFENSGIYLRTYINCKCF